MVLKVWLEKAPEAEVIKLYKDNFSQIWQLFLDNLSIYENTTKPKGNQIDQK
jgi:hypothetical protein